MGEQKISMKGVILAAGKGSRLYPVTHIIPKPLLPMANRPTMFYAFDRLKEMGITDICIVVGENETVMRETLGDGSDQGVHLTFVRQESPKGLAHAVGFAKEFVGDDPFVLYLGDAMYSKGFAEIAKRFQESDCANLNVVKHVEDPRSFGVANIQGERIVKLVEKPPVPESNYAMAGLYFFRSAIWSVLPDLQPSGRGEYEITDAIQVLVDRGETVLAGIYDGEWFDTGTLDSFLATSAFLVQDEDLIASDADVVADIGARVVIGSGARVRCTFIEDSVILPGANVEVEGTIRRCVLAGPVQSSSTLEHSIQHGDWHS